MKSNLLRAGIVGFGLAFAATPAFADTDTGANDGADEVLARVNDSEVTRAEVREFMQALPPQVQQLPEAQVLPLIVNQLISARLVEEAAVADGLEDDSEVLTRLDRAKRQILQDVYLERAIDDALTQERMEELYEAYLAENPPQDEVRARHILVNSEEDALDVIAELDDGADFEELAVERSVGPSAPEGGDLGYFTADVMVPEFSEVAFDMEPGTYAEEPLETQFGWHVIMVEDRRSGEPPAMEEVEAELREQASREVMNDLIESLRDGAEIEYVDESIEPAEDEAPVVPAPEGEPAVPGTAQ